MITVRHGFIAEVGIALDQMFTPQLYHGNGSSLAFLTCVSLRNKGKLLHRYPLRLNLITKLLLTLCKITGTPNEVE